MAMAQPSENLEELTITRVFDAPRERVWQAWTDPESMKKWHGPKDFTAPVCEIDLRVGGKYFLGMRSPDGEIYYSTGVYREIVRPERLVMTDSFADENGQVVPASHYGLGDDFSLELEVVVILKALDGKTEMTLKHVGFPPGGMRDLTRQGWMESFDKLADSLKEANEAPRP
jgi:uncharacterized protein YndB with AHSA1/START domain